MKIDLMGRRRSRDFVISLLTRELGHSLPITRHDEDVLDVWELVDCCCAYPGAMHALTTVLEPLSGAHRAFPEVLVLVQELLPEPMLVPRERLELHRLLRELQNGAMGDEHRAEIPRLYQDAIGPLGPQLRHDGHDLDLVVAQLEETTFGPDDTPPLLVFVSELTRFADGPLAEALIGWVHGLAERLGIGDTEFQSHRGQRRLGSAPAGRAGPVATGAPEHRVRRSYLVVECRPDLAGSDGLLITAWLQFDDRPGIPLHRADDPVRSAELPTLLDVFLSSGPVVSRHIDDLTIEFIVPRHLLNAPLDQMTITVGGMPRRLGIEYPVVVRSLDRLQDPYYHRSWRRKWSRLCGDREPAGICWVTEAGALRHEQLYIKLSEDSAVCLVLSFPPRSREPADFEEHWVGLLAGVPVILWSRDRRDPAIFTGECHALLDAGLLPLPERVRELRKKAVLAEDGDPHHLGLWLTLVFDDADRLPEPYAQLAQPN